MSKRTKQEYWRRKASDNAPGKPYRQNRGYTTFCGACVKMPKEVFCASCPIYLAQKSRKIILKGT